ncbi:MAG: TldD/PmbA family protein [Planctomycetota bacterium]
MRAAFACAPLVLISLLVIVPVDAAEKETGLLTALSKELDRSYEGLKDAGAAPLYFLAYRAIETERLSLSASYGALSGSSSSRSRTLDVEARVGTYEVDNTRKIRGSFDWGSSPAFTSLPLEDDEAAIRVLAWKATDSAFKAAQERLVKVKSNRAVKVEEEDPSGDFARVTPATHIGATVKLDVDRKRWEARLRRLSARFKEHAFILGSSVNLSLSAQNTWFVSSEGTRLQFGRPRARLSVNASAKAEDGMDLRLYKSFDAPTPAQLPDDNEVEKAIDRIISRLDALRKAPLVEPYTGPAIIKNEACGVFFHEIFGHRVEGHRQKDEEEGQTFTKKIGKQITSPLIDVFDDPTRKEYRGLFLNGHYLFDDEGVAAQRATLVESGILKGFLMSRSPIRGFPASNGHGRCSPGNGVVARQGNLIVEAREPVPFPRLREMLIEEVKKRGKSYGLVFHDISGGFTTTMRYGPQAFKVIPLFVQRVYTDGRPDEVVRGVDLVGTPLSSIEKVLAAADDPSVFNGTCGAESGWVPVSGVAPSILVSEIEVEKKQKSQERPPLLPPPLHDPKGKPTKGGQ